jgi:hypothetical protein
MIRLFIARRTSVPIDRETPMLPRAIIAFAIICLTGMLFPPPQAVMARGGFGGGLGGGFGGGFHGANMGAFPGAQMGHGFNGYQNGMNPNGMNPNGMNRNGLNRNGYQNGLNQNGMNRNGNNGRYARTRRDGSRPNGSYQGNSQFGMHGGNGSFARWNEGQWHTSSGFGGPGHGPSFQGQWQIGGGLQ